MELPLEWWQCPTYGCRGLIRTENEPRSGATGTCQPDPDKPGAFCGREMRWDGRAEQWLPNSPFRGFTL